MLRILQAREIWWPIRVLVPGDGGTVEGVSGEIRVPYPITREHFAALAGLGGDALSERLADFVLGWRGEVFAQEDGETLPYSRENVVATLRVDAVSAAVQFALLEVAQGRAARKNSAAGSGGSSA